MNILDIFKEPSIIGIVANANEGKSNMLYFLITELLKLDIKPNIHTFGFRKEIEFTKDINSIYELEQIKNSVIFIDEFIDLFDLDNKEKKRGIERTLRLIYHNNNILVLSGLPENFKKFISSKIGILIYKKVTLYDLINGSRVKKVIMNYSGNLRGVSTLNLEQCEALLFRNNTYTKIDIPYLEEYDTKKDNQIIVNL